MESQTQADSCERSGKPDMHVRLKTDNSLPFNKTGRPNRTCMSGCTADCTPRATAPTISDIMEPEV
jgi:hypothetical protein